MGLPQRIADWDNIIIAMMAGETTGLITVRVHGAVLQIYCIVNKYMCTEYGRRLYVVHEATVAMHFLRSRGKSSPCVVRVSICLCVCVCVISSSRPKPRTSRSIIAVDDPSMTYSHTRVDV